MAGPAEWAFRMKKSRGFIIVTALIVTAALMLMAGAYSLSIFYRNQIYMKYINSTKAYYLASCGIQFMRIKDLGEFRFSITNSSDVINVKREVVNGVTRITASANINGAVKALVCEFENDPDYMDTINMYYHMFESEPDLPITRWE